MASTIGACRLGAKQLLASIEKGWRKEIMGFVDQEINDLHLGACQR